MSIQMHSCVNVSVVTFKTVEHLDHWEKLFEGSSEKKKTDSREALNLSLIPLGRDMQSLLFSSLVSVLLICKMVLIWEAL